MTLAMVCSYEASSNTFCKRAIQVEAQMHSLAHQNARAAEPICVL